MNESSLHKICAYWRLSSDMDTPVFCSCRAIICLTNYNLINLQIIVGSIVTRAPSSTMASTAFIELGLATDLFEKGAQFSRRARSGMVSAVLTILLFCY